MVEPTLLQRVAASDLQLARVQAAWPSLIPNSLIGRAWPTKLDGRTLVVVVCDNQWLHELTYLRRDLLARIRRRCPRIPLDGLHLRLGTVPSPPTIEEEPDPPAAPAPLPPQPSPETLAALEHIHDPQLRHAIACARVALARH